MKKTKIFAHNGKVGIIPGNLDINDDMMSSFIPVKDIDITKDAFNILSKESQDDELMVIKGYFGFPGINSNIFKGATITQADKEELKDQITDIDFEEVDTDVYQEMVKEMND